MDRRHQVLIVDDEPSICALLRTALEGKHSVDTALCVKDVLRLLQEKAYDLIVTDLRLPDGSGIDILRHAKEKDKDTEVIIITAHASLDTAISAVNLGSSSYLTKPISIANFIAQAEKALSNWAFHQQSKMLVSRSLSHDTEAQEHFATITTIYELSRKLMLFLDVSDIMKTILQELVEKMRASVGAVGVSLFGEEEIFAMPRLGKVTPEQVKELLFSRWNQAFGILDRYEFTKEKVAVTVFDGADAAPQTYDDMALVVIPMIVMGRTIGSIVLLRDAALHATTAEHQFLHVFSSLASPLVENCYIHRRTKLQASIDGLTGIANHRAFQEMLSREIARSDRDKNEFCLCMIDIDDFKKVNDTYGHLIGDAVLQDLPKRIQRIIREVDTLARYGGEEFVLILPGTLLEGASILSERIRLEIANSPYMITEEKGISYTISIGLSIYSGKTPRKKQQLILDADDALYAAKSEGKNRICAR